MQDKGTRVKQGEAKMGVSNITQGMKGHCNLEMEKE